MQEFRNSNPPVVMGICDPNKSRTRHHCKLIVVLSMYTNKCVWVFLSPLNKTFDIQHSTQDSTKKCNKYKKIIQH